VFLLYLNISPPSCNSTNAVVAKKALKIPLKGRKGKKIDELIKSRKETVQKIDLSDGKGRAVIATKQFSWRDFLVEYHGNFIEITDAKKKESLYTQDPSPGCYMYYFQYLSTAYCTKLHDIHGIPHLTLSTPETLQLGRSSCTTMVTSATPPWKPTLD
ncbi:hypothetical protein A6R68_19427, partial [Neotoma lepida]